MDPIVMPMEDNGKAASKAAGLNASSSCQSHDYELMKSIVLASWRLAQHAATPDHEERGQSVASTQVITESRGLREEFTIPGSKVRLVYTSATARGYLSTLELVLTPREVPPTLERVELRISIEGTLFQRTFEADPDLKFTYAWRGLNVYKQRVSGTTTAVVKVGYHYVDCTDTIWDVQTAKLVGQALPISDIGGWNFDLHHRYNFQQGILHKGDGTNVFLRERPPLLSSVTNEKAGLVSPVALAAAADGSVLVGDFDVVRRIHPDGTMEVVFRLRLSTGSAYRYHIAINPTDGSLYLSDPESYRILRIPQAKGKDVESNFEVVAGTGARCFPDSDCGDGRRATDAKLSYPKGLAVSADGVLFFADGRAIRMVDQNGIISTLIGGRGLGQWKPWSCKGSVSLAEATLRWPTDLAMNPLDDTLHFIDDTLVMKITKDRRVHIVAGRPLHCHRPRRDHYFNFASQTTLVSPQSIAIGPDGALYVAESDSERINRVSKVGTDNRIEVFAGKDSKCNCREADCPCRHGGKEELAMDVVFAVVSSIAVGPDGSLYISDSQNRRVSAVRSRIPELNKRQEYLVHSPDTQECYVFNRFGLHLETRDLITRQPLYKFSYSVATSNGHLTGISSSGDASAIKVMRLYGRVTAIESPRQHTISLRLDRNNMLSSIKWAANLTRTYAYLRNTELIESKQDERGEYSMFTYDRNGRLEKAITSTGEAFGLKSDLELRGAVLNVTRQGQPFLSLLIRPGLIQASLDDEERVTSISMLPDRGFIMDSKRGARFTLETTPFTVSGQEKESFPIPSAERTDLGRDLVNLFEWDFEEEKNKISKNLKVNGGNLLSIERTHMSTSDIVSLDNSQAVLNISETSDGFHLSVLPSGLFSSLNFGRNSLGQASTWRWGDRSVQFEYDRRNRLKSVRMGDKERLSYVYADTDTSLPQLVELANGGAFAFQRDRKEALEAITTPRGHIHGFSIKHSLGIKKYRYRSPWSRAAYESHYDALGGLVAKVFPAQSGKIVHRYTQSGQPKITVGGATVISYHYFSGNGMVKNVERTDEDMGLHMRSELKYHLGLLKEIHTVYHCRDENTQMAEVKLKYQFDGRARLSTVLSSIGREESTAISYQYDLTTGAFKGIDDLRLRQESLRKTLMEDTSGLFSNRRQYDMHGRLASQTMRVRDRDVFTIAFSYNGENQIRERQVQVDSAGARTTLYEYNADGQLEKATDGQESWTYTHDVNGNMVSMTRGRLTVSLGYDSGDRVTMLGQAEYVTYNKQGFVSRRGKQRYAYNGLGQLQSASEPGRFSVIFYYDSIGRLVGKRDHADQVVQFVYANPTKPSLVTHMHYPKAERTYQFLHDDQDTLVALDSPEGRYWIATDLLGSPVAVFDSAGKLVKEIALSPFGQVLVDTNSALDLPFGFAGGLADRYTQLIHFGNRVYDPVVGQWMTPKLLIDSFRPELRWPTDLFAYRFRNNDPVSLPSSSTLVHGEL